jgi:hypothetical protein
LKSCFKPVLQPFETFLFPSYPQKFQQEKKKQIRKKREKKKEVQSLGPDQPTEALPMFSLLLKAYGSSSSGATYPFRRWDGRAVPAPP